MHAYLQFKAGPTGPFQTVEVPHKNAPLGSPTRSDSKTRLPSPHMVKYLGKWRRVYSTSRRNTNSDWVLIDGDRIPVDIRP
jgi:hypothetical protein